MTSTSPGTERARRRPTSTRGRSGTPGYRDFTEGEEELREFLAARVWSSLEGPRALFDRAVVWLVNNRVLLPGVTTLARMVAPVRQEENDRLHAALYEAVPYDLRTEMVRLLEVPEKKRVSELERLRLGPMRVSGRAMELALDRAREVRGPGAGAVDAGRVTAARMTGLARYGLTSKAPTLKRLEVTRQTATLLATVRHLETATVDDALDLLHTLMATKLLAKAERRRDVFARDGNRWGDPRVKLLAGEKWTAAEPKVLTALGLESEPAGHLAELASALHAAYVQAAAGLPGNTALEVVAGRLKLAKLGKAEEPKLMPPFRQLVNGMLPKVDFPARCVTPTPTTSQTTARPSNGGALRGLITSTSVRVVAVVIRIRCTGPGRAFLELVQRQ
ncbi:DUF4158 domain-containing protein [Streptomyces brevispora]|uniref:DUF4158 domain-containing protein n=1 Tax=Streptomyces brevispora TaxID=887462 RepID=UPI0035D83063